MRGGRAWSLDLREVRSDRYPVRRRAELDSMRRGAGWGAGRVLCPCHASVGRFNVRANLGRRGSSAKSSSMTCCRGNSRSESTASLSGGAGPGRADPGARLGQERLVSAGPPGAAPPGREPALAVRAARVAAASVQEQREERDQVATRGGIGQPGSVETKPPRRRRDPVPGGDGRKSVPVPSSSAPANSRIPGASRLHGLTPCTTPAARRRSEVAGLHPPSRGAGEQDAEQCASTHVARDERPSICARGVGVAILPRLTLAGGDARVAVRELPGRSPAWDLYAVARASFGAKARGCAHHRGADRGGAVACPAPLPRRGATVSFHSV